VPALLYSVVVFVLLIQVLPDLIRRQRLPILWAFVIFVSF
jgi:hypothetical protein